MSLENAIKEEFRSFKAGVLETVAEQIKIANTGFEDIAKKAKKRKIVKVKDKKEIPNTVEVFHQILKPLTDLVNNEENVLLIGPAGSGKTTMAEQCSEVLGLEFRLISVGMQTSKTDLFGYMDANGNYVTSAFRESYEKGGVFLMDELDAGNSNTIVMINSALSNGVCSFPDKMVKRHADFRFVASANTYGTGSDIQYVGRNQLDASTLDRFVKVIVTYDLLLEDKLVQSKEVKDIFKKLRKVLEERGTLAIASTRAMMRTEKLLSIFEGNKKDLLIDIIKKQVLGHLSETEKNEVINKIK